MNITEQYNIAVAAAKQETDKFKSLANKYSFYRLIAFAVFVIAVVFAISIEEIGIIVFAAVLLIIGFSWLIKKQNHFDTFARYYAYLKQITENELQSIKAGSGLYDNGSAFNNPRHFYTADLDIFGNNSLFHLVNRAATWAGVQKLASWLNKPSTENVILQRQAAVKEIAQKNEWKLNFQAYLLFSVNQQKDQLNRLIAYLNTTVELKDQAWLKLYCRIAPFLLISVIIAGYFYSPLRYFTPFIALYNYRLASSNAQAVDKTDLIAGKISQTLTHFVEAFKGIEEQSWQSVYLKEQAERIKSADGESISEKTAQLAALINKLNYRLNLVVKFILNIFLVWDIRCLMAIEAWKQKNRQHVEQAFDVIAEFEAIISLASLHINYPEWCLPQIIKEDGYTLTASNIAHPLIGAGKRVANDYDLQNTFKIDIITGSNMAGKSTFLRTIGINCVLAFCGAPICADSMQVSVMKIFTYMRIKDSLNENTSTFKAELDRLQLLLNTVEGDSKLFFLIDEMLRGTNSVDKYLGSKAVIEQLIKKRAVGMVATHDLQIAELEKEHPDYVRNFYFDIEVKNGEMISDYKIKHGECKTFNASLLLKQIGIDIEK